MHNLHDSGPNSSITCLIEPDCVDAVNEGWFNAEYHLSLDTLSDVSLIDTKRNVAIETKTDKGCDEDAPDALTSNGITIASFSIIGLATYSLSVVIGQDELKVV